MAKSAESEAETNRSLTIRSLQVDDQSLSLMIQCIQKNSTKECNSSDPAVSLEKNGDQNCPPVWIVAGVSVLPPKTVR